MEPSGGEAAERPPRRPRCELGGVDSLHGRQFRVRPWEIPGSVLQLRWVLLECLPELEDARGGGGAGLMTKYWDGRGLRM